MRILIDKTSKKFFVPDITKDYHCQFGYFKKADLKKKSGTIKSNTGKEMLIFEPSFADLYRRIKRSAQIVPLKDIGAIVAETGIGKDSVVVDSGSGSGAMACFLAHLVKRVHTFDIREDFMEIAKMNIEKLGLKNVTIKKQDAYENVPVKDADLVFLDLPEPWLAVENALVALKAGGYLVSYSPTIPQIMDFSNAVRKRDDAALIKVTETIERQWECNDRKVRPKSNTMHSGFIAYARKMG